MFINIFSAHVHGLIDLRYLRAKDSISFTGLTMSGLTKGSSAGFLFKLSWECSNCVKHADQLTSGIQKDRGYESEAF